VRRLTVLIAEIASGAAELPPVAVSAAELWTGPRTPGGYLNCAGAIALARDIASSGAGTRAANAFQSGTGSGQCGLMSGQAASVTVPRRM
jgi:hypothetical protein